MAGVVAFVALGQIESQVIATVRLALRADPERRNVEQLDAEVEQHPRVSGLYLKLDLVQRFATFAGFNRSLIVGHLDDGPEELKPLRPAADLRLEDRIKRIGGNRVQRTADL